MKKKSYRDFDLMDNGKLKKFLKAKENFEKLDQQYIDLINFMPGYLGSNFELFPNAPSPNKVKGLMDEFIPEWHKAVQSLGEATDELIAELRKMKKKLA
jgi:hypothetical protein